MYLNNILANCTIFHLFDGAIRVPSSGFISRYENVNVEYKLPESVGCMSVNMSRNQYSNNLVDAS